MGFKNVVLGIGIFVVFVFLVGYGIEAFYPSPDYNVYCKSSNYAYPNYPDKIATNCSYSKTLENLSRQCFDERGTPVYEYDNNGCQVSLTCDYCSKDYEDANKVYTRNVFVISLLIGLLTMAIGAFIFSIETIGAGLMAGGVGTIFYGCVRNWPNFSNMMKFILLFFALVLMILLGYKLNNKLNWKIFKKKKR